MVSVKKKKHQHWMIYDMNIDYAYQPTFEDIFDAEKETSILT